MQWWLFAPKSWTKRVLRQALILCWVGPFEIAVALSMTVSQAQQKQRLTMGLLKHECRMSIYRTQTSTLTLQIYPWMYSPPKKERERDTERDSVIYQYQWMAPTSASAADSPTQSAPDTIENNLQVHSPISVYLKNQIERMRFNQIFV